MRTFRVPGDRPRPPQGGEDQERNVLAAPRIPVSAGPALRSHTAMYGTARPVNWSPMRERSGLPTGGGNRGGAQRDRDPRAGGITGPRQGPLG